MSLVDGYAQAIFDIAEGEEILGDVEEELFRFERALAASPDLIQGLGDLSVPAAQRQEMIEELLTGKVHSQTVAIVSMIVGAGRSRQLPEILERFLELAAASRNKVVANVRVAGDIDQDHRARLEQALSQATGKDVEVRVIIDPNVIGGVRAEIGDQVIDGTIRARLDRFQEDLRRA